MFLFCDICYKNRRKPDSRWITLMKINAFALNDSNMWYILMTYRKFNFATIWKEKSNIFCIIISFILQPCDWAIFVHRHDLTCHCPNTFTELDWCILNLTNAMRYQLAKNYMWTPSGEKKTIKKIYIVLDVSINII